MDAQYYCSYINGLVGHTIDEVVGYFLLPNNKLLLTEITAKYKKDLMNIGIKSDIDIIKDTVEDEIRQKSINQSTELKVDKEELQQQSQQQSQPQQQNTTYSQSMLDVLNEEELIFEDDGSQQQEIEEEYKKGEEILNQNSNLPYLKRKRK